MCEFCGSGPTCCVCGRLDMTATQLQKMVRDAGLRDNAGMIRVYRHHPDGSVSCVHRTFRTDSVVRFLKRKSGKFSVSQGP